MASFPRSIPTDSQLLLGILGLALLLFLNWMFFNWMEHYAEKKEKEIERELEELEETGEVY